MGAATPAEVLAAAERVSVARLGLYRANLDLALALERLAAVVGIPVERLRALLRRGEGRGGTSCPASAPHLVRGYYDSSEAIAYAPIRHSLPRPFPPPPCPRPPFPSASPRRGGGGEPFPAPGGAQCRGAKASGQGQALRVLRSLALRPFAPLGPPCPGAGKMVQGARPLLEPLGWGSGGAAAGSPAEFIGNPRADLPKSDGMRRYSALCGAMRPHRSGSLDTASRSLSREAWR